MTTPEGQPGEGITISSTEVSATILGGLLTGTILGPLAIIPGLLLGVGAGYLIDRCLVDNLDAQVAIKKFVQDHRPSDPTS